MRYLFLWDIDGTLIHNPHSPGGSLEECWRAVRAVTGEKNLQPPARLDGSTDWRILLEILEASGLPLSLAPDALQALEGSTTSHSHLQKSRKLVPGAKEVLAKASSLGVQTYATGNSRNRAIAKTSAFGLDVFLQADIGGFGDRSWHREEFVREAINLAQERYSGLQAVVIGDTPFDIEAARSTNSLAVAVAGGQYSEKDLQEHAPDLLVANWNGSCLFDFLDNLPGQIDKN